jgi:tetratricopeptide (TPR) repeat protein
MFRSVVCSWLPAIALSLSLPVSPQAQVDSLPEYSAAENSAEMATSADIPRMTTTPAHLTPEQMGDFLRTSGRYQAAIEAYAQIAQPSAVVWNKRGIAYQFLYDLKDAVRCYKESLKLQPVNPIVLNDLATAQESLQDFQGAEHLYRKALELDPHNAQILKNLGTNLLMQQKYDKGTEAYKQALAINPHILDARTGPKVNEPGPVQILSTANYIKARSCAQAGMADCAAAYLQQALNEGSATVKQVNEDADFAKLRSTPAIAQLIAEQK